MGPASDFYHTYNIDAPLRLQYWPWFDINVHALSPRKIEELDRILHEFISGLPAYSRMPPQYLRARGCRSRSWPSTTTPAGRYVPMSTSAQCGGEWSSSYRRSKESFGPPRDPRQKPMVGTKPANQANGSRTDRPSFVAASQPAPHVTHPTGRGSQANGQTEDFDGDIEISEDTDSSSTSVDFLSILRQQDPEMALQLERQHHMETADLRESQEA